MTDTSISLETMLDLRVPAMKNIYVIWFVMLSLKRSTQNGRARVHETGFGPTTLTIYTREDRVAQEASFGVKSTAMSYTERADH